MNITRRVFLPVIVILGQAVAAAQDNKLPAELSGKINSELPRWLHLGGEERTRTEYIVGQGFKSINDLYLLNRLRLNLDIRPASWLKFSFQAEDARVFGQNARPAPASQKDAMDLRVGYVQFGSDEGAVALRAGRQGLDFGGGRLLADPNWSNVGRTFDAARLTLRRGRAKLDLFSGDVVKIDATAFDELTPGGHFHGAYGSLGGLVPNAAIEPYVFWRLEHRYRNESGALGNLDEKTIGFRWAGRLPLGFDYEAELAGQAGSWAGDRIGAWMGHWLVGHTWTSVSHKPRVFLEYNRASGDSHSHDGRHGTFDGLFASSHDKYGLTDLLCSSNIVYLRPAFQYSVHPKLIFVLAYNDMRLANARDGLYVGGKSVARSPNGSAGVHIGQESDMQAQWTMTRSSQVTVGYGRLFPGQFLRRTTSGMPYNITFCNLSQRF
ncbi:MAG: alginate export family protein [Bryobacteraceae bacterium]